MLDHAHTERAVIAIAGGESDHQQMATWLRDRLQPLPPTTTMTE